MDAYLDESGIHKDARACVVAGFFGTKISWRRFEKEWRAVLRRFNVLLEDFHTSEFAKQHKLQRLLEALAHSVARSKIHPVSCGMFVADFFKLSEKQRRFVTGATWDGKKFQTSGSPNKPYFTVFTECIKAVDKYCRLGERAHFYCGIDRPAFKYANEVFADYRLRPTGNKLGMIASPMASETPHLQAADLFSHLTYKYMLECGEHSNWPAPSGVLGMLLSNRKDPADTSFRTEAMLREMMSVIPNMD